MNEDSYYVELLLQKYRLAVALAVLRNKPDDISIESYITNMRNRIQESELCDSLTNISVDDDDFNMSDSEINFNLSLNIIEDNSNDSVTILKDFDYNALDTVNQNPISEVEEILKNLEDNEPGNSMLTEMVTKNTQIDNIIATKHQIDKDPINNFQTTETDLIYSENDIQLKLRVENNLQRDMVEDNNDVQSLITQEIDYNVIENYTHISQSQDNITIQQNLFKNKRKLESIEMRNNKKIFMNTNKVGGSLVKETPTYENIELEDAQNDLVSQSVQMHIHKKVKPIKYTEDTIDTMKPMQYSENTIDTMKPIRYTKDSIDTMKPIQYNEDTSIGIILENVPIIKSTNNANRIIEQETLFSPDTQNCSFTQSIFQINSNDCDTDQNSSQKLQNDFQNHLSLDFSFENTSQKQNLSKENISNYSKTQSLGSNNLDSLNDTNSLNFLIINEQINSHTQKHNDKMASSYASVSNLNENIQTLFRKDTQHIKEHINKEINERDDSTINDTTNINESTLSSQDSYGFLSVKHDAIHELNPHNEIEFSNQVIRKINRINERNVDKKGTNESHVPNVVVNERNDYANETNDFSNETNDFTASSDDEMNDLSESQTEIVPFKVMEELNKIKTFLNRSDVICSENRSDSGYKSSTRVSFNSASQSGLWLNQSSHSLFSYISQTPLLVSTMDINYEIAKVLGELIDRLHEDEKYPTFLEEMLEFIDNLLLYIYEGTSSDENVFLKNNESIDRLILLNKSRNIIKFTIEKIIKILESFYDNLQNGVTIELDDINRVENLSYIFHFLEVLLKKYISTKLSQNSQSQDEKILKRSTLTEIWRRKWSLNKSEEFQKVEKQDVLVQCSDILNKIVVKSMEGYSLVAYAALQCFNLLQS